MFAVLRLFKQKNEWFTPYISKVCVIGEGKDADCDGLEDEMGCDGTGKINVRNYMCGVGLCLSVMTSSNLVDGNKQ